MRVVIKRRDTTILTERQEKMLYALSEGCNAKEIGKQLGLSPRTIEMHIASMRDDFDCKNVTHLVATMLRQKVIK